MSAPADSFDLRYDVRTERHRRWQKFRRVVFPVATALVMIAAIVAIAAYMYQLNREDARALSDDLLEALDQRIVTEVQVYLEAASSMVEFAEDVFKDQALSDYREVLAEPLAKHVLENYPQLANFAFSDPQGNFMMLRKTPDGAIDTKHIERHNDIPEVTWVRRNSAGEVIVVEKDPEDRFDPRTRPWYLGAVENAGPYWTDVYVFHTDREPGVTASLPVYDEKGELAAVFALDIELKQLSAFLSSLEIGRRGRAMIIDNRGTLVAYPKLERMFKEVDGQLQPLTLEELGDPVLNRAFDRFRVESVEKLNLLVDDERHIATISPLPSGTGRDWRVLIVAPEDDFVGFVRKHNRTGLLMASGVFLLASVLAGWLVIQGLRADRNSRLVLDRQDDLETQSRAFSELASRAAVFDSGDKTALHAVTETLARTVRCKRVSIWHLADSGKALVCDDCFERDSGGHTEGARLAEDDLPQLFQVIKNGEDIVALDSANDPRTAELHRLYLHPVGCRGLVSVSIKHAERAMGAVWLEDDGLHRDSYSQAVTFAHAIANMLALRHSEQFDGNSARYSSASEPSTYEEGIKEPRRRVYPQRELTAPMRPAELLTGRRGEAFLSRLAKELGDDQRLGADVFSDATVLVLHLTDPVSIAEAIDGKRNALDYLTRKLEQMAPHHQVDYLKLVGDHVVCATDCKHDSGQGASRMADFALAIQEECTWLFTELNRPLGFQLGIDSGPVIGSAVGRSSMLNLWGEAVVTAAWMAEAGVPGAIQVTESTYRRLHDHYLFRVRGTFYLKGFGELTTYLLTGRL